MPTDVTVAPDAVRRRAETAAAAADDWIRDRAEQFDPQMGETHRKRSLRGKAFPELGLYQYATSGDDVPTVLERRGNDPQYYRRLRRTPAEASEFAFPLIALDEAGALVSDARTVLTETLDRPAARPGGRPVFRQLAYWHARRAFGLESELDPADLLTNGYVARRLNPAVVDRGATFGLTHELLSYHGFGSGHPALPDDPAAYDHPSTLTGLIFRYIGEEHVDLVGELLLCGVLQRQLAPDFVRFVFGWLADHTDGGALVFPASDDETLRELLGSDVPAWEGRARRWRVRYHPTIVYGLTARALREAWPALRDRPARGIAHDAHHEDLLTLAQTVSSFANYELDAGARSLESLAGTATAAAYDDVVRDVVGFLRHQRNEDGTYGSWAAERPRFDGSFDEELLAPLSELCDTVLAAVDE